MKIKNKKILVFGYFGYITNQLDGQTVKTREIYNLIKEKCSIVTYVDSQEFHYNLTSVFRFFIKLIKCDSLIWLPAQNNLKWFFPIILLFSKIFKFDINYIVIGGWLSSNLKKLPFHRRYLKKIRAILVENKTTINELQTIYGYDNLLVIPNFRRSIPVLNMRKYDGRLKIVFMARINIMKGLDIINRLIEFLPGNVTITFYGPINDQDKYYFENMISKHMQLSYGGCLNPDQIPSILSKYDIMLFPTRFFTEGFPGSVLDAYRAGIPVIATEWKHAHEFIIDKETGFIVDFENPLKEIIELIKVLNDTPKMLNNMKVRAYEEAKKYTTDAAWAVLSQIL